LCKQGGDEYVGEEVGIDAGAGGERRRDGFGASRCAFTFTNWSERQGSETCWLYVLVGWVQTEMGDSVREAVMKTTPSVPQITVEESAKGCVKIALEVKSPSTEKIYNYDGTATPW